METEIKLRFNSKEELMSILKADWFKDYCLDSGDKEPVRLTNEYFDTPDRILLEKGTSVRVRRYDDGTVTHYEHTVKFGGSVVDGLHQQKQQQKSRQADQQPALAPIRDPSPNEFAPDEDHCSAEKLADQIRKILAVQGDS